MLGTNVDEVNVHAINLSDELRQGVQSRLDLAPVVIGGPITGDLLHRGELHALRRVRHEIDGVDIHFIHVRSKHENALPLIITHGWPGSIVEELKVIDPLANPTAHDGSASDAFDVVIPSLPGYGFARKPTELGCEPVRIARAWTVLMKRLGYTRFVASGGDWGDPVTEQMAVLAPSDVLGIQ